MKIQIDPKIPTPLNEQIRLQILRQIAEGTLGPDECLPSIRFVARELGIGIVTVKTAYEKLEADGFIYTVAGKGCFVSPSPPSETGTRLSLAREHLKPEIDYIRSLGLSEDELVSVIKELYKETAK